MKVYAGIGSRSTPADVLSHMGAIAQILEEKGFVLRTGGAAGADTAFEHAVSRDRVVVYRPQGDGVDNLPSRVRRYDPAVWKSAERIAAMNHPKFHKLTSYVQALHTRNVFQILGDDLGTPSWFVVCWTPDGAERAEETSRETGGTGTAIRIAGARGVPVYNLKNPSSSAKLAFTWLTGVTP